MKDLNLYYDNLIQYGIATQEEINLVTNINGWNEQTFNNILYVKTGYRDWEQYEDIEE
jgi:hypothetical protein